MSQYRFYLCGSENDRQSYTGITKDPTKRLRQHRGEIKKGAPYPLSWPCKFPRYILQITNFPLDKNARFFELQTKERFREKTYLTMQYRKWRKSHNLAPSNNIKERIYKIVHLLTLPRWKSLDLKVILPCAIYRDFVKDLLRDFTNSGEATEHSTSPGACNKDKADGLS